MTFSPKLPNCCNRSCFCTSCSPSSVKVVVDRFIFDARRESMPSMRVRKKKKNKNSVPQPHLFSVCRIRGSVCRAFGGSSAARSHALSAASPPASGVSP